MKVLTLYLLLLNIYGYNYVKSQVVSPEKVSTEEMSVAKLAELLTSQFQSLKEEQVKIRSEVKFELQSVKAENRKLKRMFAKLQDKKENEYEQRTQRKEEDISVVSVKDDPIQNLLTLLSQRSCHDWKLMGFVTSGYYLIDPDGKGIGEPPFSVFCDMITGYTFIHHNSEGKQNVSSCSGSSCYTQTITYNATSSQTEALIRISDSCQQYIQIDCYESSLYDGDESLSWWEDRNNNKQTYWSGDNPAVKGCSCGLTKSCVNPRTQCNCDSAMTGHWLRDSGYITNSTTLPVSKLHFGTTADAKPLQMEYELGPLRCYGRKHISYPESCQDIWISGSFSSGYYTLGIPDNTRQVYCNMSQIWNKDYQATNISESVAFYATLAKRATTPGTVVFSNAVVNIGNAYNPSTGVFTAPYDGLYEFYFYGYGYTNTWVRCVKNNLNLAAMQVQATKWNTLAFSSMMELKSGDNVHVYLGAGQLYEDTINGFWTAFSGKLL